MAIKKSISTRLTINLDGPDGNVFYLIGCAGTFSKQLELDFESIQKEMMSGTYNHALLVFEENFGDYVDLETDNESFLYLFEDFQSYKSNQLSFERSYSIKHFIDNYAGRQNVELTNHFH